jgi:cbb3-type cytochrome oxidase maturation protein
MEAIIVIMLISLTVALGFLASFLVTVRSGQYQDMVEPSIAMLLENQIPPNCQLQSQKAASEDILDSPNSEEVAPLPNLKKKVNL